MDAHEKSSPSVAQRSGPRRGFRPARTVALMAVLAVLCGAGYLYVKQATSAAAQSVFADMPELNTRLEFPDATYFDLGELEEESPFEHRFRVRNLGPEPFNSLDFKWSCGSCSKSHIELETDPLPPGEESFIHVSSQVAPVHRGAHRREFPVVIEEIEHLAFTLTLAYNVRWEPRVGLLVPKVEFVPMWQQAEPQTRYNEIHLDGPPNRGSYHVHSIETDTPGVTCVTKAADPNTPQRELVGVTTQPIEVRVDPERLPLGSFTANITIHTDCGTVELPVTGRVTDGVALVPESILLPGNSKAPAEQHFFVRNVSDVNLVFETASASTEQVRVEILSDDRVVQPGKQIMVKVHVDDPTRLHGESRVLVSYRLGIHSVKQQVPILRF